MFIENNYAFIIVRYIYVGLSTFVFLIKIKLIFCRDYILVLKVNGNLILYTYI